MFKRYSDLTEEEITQIKAVVDSHLTNEDIEKFQQSTLSTKDNTSIWNNLTDLKK